MVSALWKTAWKFLKRLMIELPYDTTTTLGIYPEKTNSKTYMHLNVHSRLIAIAKTWKQLKCPLTEEWIKKMWVPTYSEYCCCCC